MKLSKVALAIAGALAVAAGSAHAGQINSSSSTLATEVIYSNAQVVRAPSNSYSFAGDVDARTNEQRLQLQYTLTKGTWAVGAGQKFTAVGTAIDGSALLAIAYNDSANAAQTTLPTGSTVSAFLSADAKQLVFNITIPAANVAENLLKTPIFTINAGPLTGGTNVGLSGLLDVAGPTACVAPDTETFINFKHFTNHTGGTNVLVNASPDSEHLRAGSTNEARLLSFTQNLRFVFTPSTVVGQTDAATVNRSLRGTNWATQTLIGTGTPITPPAALPAAVNGSTPSQYYMGHVKLDLRGTGLDTDYAHVYGDVALPVTPATFAAADFTPVTEAVAGVGAIEYTKYAVTLTLPAAWPANSAVVVTNGAAATALADVSVTFNAARTQVTLQATSAAGAAALSNGAYVFGQFNGVNAIPQTGTITAQAAIEKAPAGAATFFAEQNNICPGTFTGIGGGIKIDLRNYASFATFGTSGPATTVRLINNSETQTADIYAQMIYADGTYGAWGQLQSLKPREVANLSNQTIEAALTNAAPAANPFGAGAVGYEAKGGAAVVGGSKAGISDRLRIVSNTGNTLRVQSYMVVGNSVIDTSNAQGVDFAETGDRTLNDRQEQLISQDAINGLGR